MNNFSFEYPLVLLLIPLYLFITLYFKKREQAYYIPNIIGFFTPVKKKINFQVFLQYLIIMGTIIALASPIYTTYYINKDKHTLDIVLNVDTSGSMSLNGLNKLNYSQTRLDVVKDVVKDFILERQKDRLGLVIFGDYSRILSPLTYDNSTLLTTTDSISIGMVGKSTALIDSILQATTLLKNSFSSSKIIILLSDGDDTLSKVPLEVALHIAQKYNIKIYTISIGESNNNLLQLVAKESNAQSFIATNKQDLQKIYTTITKLQKSTHYNDKEKKINYLFFYFILSSLLLSVLLLFYTQKNAENTIKSIFSQRVLKKITFFPETLTTSRHILLFFVIILYLLALFIPSLVINKNKIQSIPLVIALDISNSMNTSDVYPSRFILAINKINTILNLDKDIHLRVALLLFNTEAFLAFPMSEDLEALHNTLSRINHKLHSGSNIFAALEGSKYLLRSYNSKQILLLSDGASSQNFEKELTFLQDNNLILHTLFIGTNKIQNKRLKNLTQKSSGAFQTYTFGQNDIEFLLKQIINNSHKKSKFRNKNTKIKHLELFYIPISLALLLLFYIFLHNYEFKKKPNNLAILFFMSIVFTHPSEAALLDFLKINKALECYQKHDYTSAIQIYKNLSQTKELKYNLANSFYKNKEYKKAINTYKSSFSTNSDINAKIYFNIANAYFHLQKLSSAKKYYIKSLQVKNDIIVQENLEILLYFIKNKRALKLELTDKYTLPNKMRNSSLEMREPIHSRYVIKLTKIVLNEEEKWLQIINKNQTKIYLQKLHTTKVSHNALHDD